MAYFLKKSNLKKGTYLQIYESFYDSAKKQTSHRSHKAVFCKYFLDKVAKYFWTLLHVQIGQSCKAVASRA